MLLRIIFLLKSFISIDLLVDVTECELCKI